MLDVISIVDKLESLGLVRTVKVSGDWYQMYCPFHNKGNEKKPSFGILVRDQYRNGINYPAGFGHCFSCGFAGDLLSILKKLVSMHRLSTDFESWISEQFPEYNLSEDIEYLLSEDVLDSLSNKYAISQISEKLSDSKVEFVPESELASYRFTVPYMYERKLTDKIIADYDIGVDLNWIPEGRKRPVPCITFPVRDADKNTLFVVRRSIQGKLFNYPRGASKPVYGLEMVPPDCTSVVITESCFNALTAVSYGYPAVALLGTGNDLQLHQLKSLGVQEFVLCMDGDAAGHRATKKLKAALSSVAIVWVIDMPEGKDLNDLTKEEFEQLYLKKF